MKHDVAIVGAGYVGLPLARTFADAGKRVLLVDVDEARVEQLNAGESYIEDVPTDVLAPLVDADPEALAEAVASASMPRNRPVLYGDGHASERIAQVLVATIPSR